jgi:hypothetical protein
MPAVTGGSSTDTIPTSPPSSVTLVPGWQDKQHDNIGHYVVCGGAAWGASIVAIPPWDKAKAASYMPIYHSMVLHASCKLMEVHKCLLD